MSITEGDSLPYLRKRQTLADTDCNAVIRTGENSYKTLPVLIRDGGCELFVEVDYAFTIPSSCRDSCGLN